MTERTCKTCNSYNNSACYCSLHSTSEAEWNSCEDHKTYDEIVEELNAERLNMIKVGSFEFHNEIRERLVTLLCGNEITNIEASYILAKFDNDPKVVTKPDGIYLAPELIIPDSESIYYTEKRSTP